MQPMSPMSWYSGSQLTPWSSSPTSRPSCIIAQELAMRFWCVTTTPLGSEVLPEVNCRKATSSSLTCDTSGRGPGAGPAMSSVQ